MDFRGLTINAMAVLMLALLLHQTQVEAAAARRRRPSPDVRDTATVGKSTAAASWSGEIDATILAPSWHPSQRVIAKLNKEGVIYRRDKKSTSEGDKESESSKKGAYSSKYFTSVHKDVDVDEDDVKEDERDNANGTTPAPSVARKLMNDDPQPSVLFNCSKGDQTDPIQITNDLPARSSSSLSSSAFASARPNGPQKRKCMPSAKVRSPYLSEKNANKRQIREGKTPEETPVDFGSSNVWKNGTEINLEAVLHRHSLTLPEKLWSLK
ncbi:hypothetical protein ACQ4PT_026211 [Festuca glaucescens]